MIKKIKKIFGFKISNGVLIILSVISAIAIWFYVFTNERPEISKVFINIPVTIDSTGLIGNALMISDPIEPVYVDVTVHGMTGAVKALKPEDIIAYVDFKTLDLTEIESAQDIYAQIKIMPINTIEITNKSPQDIIVTLDKRERQDFQIQVKVQSDLPADEYTISLTAEPEKITVLGPKSKVLAVSYAEAKINVKNLQSREFVALIDLYDADGNIIEDRKHLEISDATVNIVADITKNKKVPLKHVLDGKIPSLSMNDIKTEIEPKEIMISGIPELIDAISEIELLPRTDITYLFDVNNYTMEIILPEGVRCLEGISTAAVKITVPAMEVRKLLLRKENIRIVNIPEGVTVEVTTANLEVPVRGDYTERATVSASDVFGIVDMSEVDISLGAVQQVPLIIEFSSKFTSLQEEGQMFVYINITS